MDELQAASAVGQGDLFRAYESRLAEHGARAAQVLLTAADIAARTNYLNARQTLRRLIEWGVVPVVNENDTTATDEITFGDNDFLAAQVAILLDARLLVLLTNTDGLFTPPIRAVDREAEADRRGRPTSPSWRAWRSATAPRPSAPAGCAARSRRPRWPARPASRRRSATAPAPARSPPRRRAIRSARASRPRPSKASSFKLWLKYAKPAHGRLRSTPAPRGSCARAAPACCRSAITAVEGDFDAGDAVEVVADGAVVGKGIADYSAQELPRVIGLKSAEVRERLPHAADEVIHRDRFVLARLGAVPLKSGKPLLGGGTALIATLSGHGCHD